MTAGAIAVLGPGGVGGLLAGALARNGSPVVIVAREQTAAAINERGLQVRSPRFGEFTAHPRAVAQLVQPVCALIVATKAPALLDALARVHCDPPLVLPLLNGLDHIPLLREHYRRRNGGPERVLAGSVRVQAQRAQPGVIVHASRMLQIEMACADPDAAASMQWLAAMLAAIGVDSCVIDSEAQVMWSKLVRLNAIACATSAYDLPLGPIRSSTSMHEQLVGAVEEGSRVARAEGADIDADVTLAELASLPDEASTSMRRDIADGQPPELDAIPGAVLRAAARQRIPCPVITDLVERIVSRTGLPAPDVDPFS